MKMQMHEEHSTEATGDRRFSLLSRESSGDGAATQHYIIHCLFRKAVTMSGVTTAAGLHDEGLRRRKVAGGKEEQQHNMKDMSNQSSDPLSAEEEDTAPPALISTPQQEKDDPSLSIRRSIYASDIEEDNATSSDSGASSIYKGSTTHGIMHVIDSTSKEPTLNMWIDDVPYCWSWAVKHYRCTTSYDTFTFTPFSTGDNWDKLNPKLKIYATVRKKSTTSNDTTSENGKLSVMTQIAAVLLGLCIAYIHMHIWGFSTLKKATNTTLGDGPVPRPKDWHLWGYWNFKERFNCTGYLNDGTKPPPTMDDWETMLKAYNEMVDPTYKFDADVPPTEGYRLNENGPPPYYPKLSPGKGRGLFASRDIQKGEIVHNGTTSDVIFPNDTSWKRFMFALPRKMACDQWEWTFTQQFEEGGPMKIVSSLNIAILMNEGDEVGDDNVQPQDGKGNFDEYTSVFYALRDIKQGEEILMNYADYDTDFEAAGLGELILSELSCTSFETCSVKEFWAIFKRICRDPIFLVFVGVQILILTGFVLHIK